MTTELAPSAIGVFDSGVGGLTVLASLIKNFKHDNFIYVGDTARVPYGNKSASTIKKYSQQIMEFLVSQKVKCIVVACNSASSQITEKEFQGVPVLTVIEPGAAEAVRATQSGRIGVLGTKATVNSGAYANAIKRINSQFEVFQQACPLFVPLVEEGWVDDPVTNLIVFRYLQPILQHNLDTLVLGCTHYPLLKSAIQKVAGSSVTLIESGDAVSSQLRQDITYNKIQAALELNQQQVKLYATDLDASFASMAHKILTTQKFSLEPLQLSL